MNNKNKIAILPEKHPKKKIQGTEMGLVKPRSESWLADKHHLQANAFSSVPHMGPITIGTIRQFPRNHPKHAIKHMISWHGSSWNHASVPQEPSKTCNKNL